MSGVWKRSYGRPTKAPPDERGGNRHGRPNATAPHPDSTRPRHWDWRRATAETGQEPTLSRVARHWPKRPVLRTRCNPRTERLENVLREGRARRTPHVLHLSRGRKLECRGAGCGVRGLDRRIPRRGPGAAARVPAPATGAPDPWAVPRSLLPTADPFRADRRAQATSPPVGRRRQCRDHRARFARGLVAGVVERPSVAQ